ncbi:hypothetical protein MKX34_13080 [Paenibacillus sp. FSL R5-0636]|uniref:hypothetical protein n=1 Tax=unclassified Paenibacillus TaxID=185978 RepID=UPI0030CDB950
MRQSASSDPPITGGSLLCVFGRSYGMLQYVSIPDKPMPPNHSRPSSGTAES